MTEKDSKSAHLVHAVLEANIDEGLHVVMRVHHAVVNVIIGDEANQRFHVFLQSLTRSL